MSVLFTKTVYDPAEEKDGMRLIIMRRYPRGIAKSRAHAWIPHLAPTLPLVHWYHDHKNAIERQWHRADPARFEQEIAEFWRVYSRRYHAEIKAQRPLIEFLASLQRDFGVTLTLLCACPDHRICHRSLLGQMIEAVPPRV